MNHNMNIDSIQPVADARKRCEQCAEQGQSVQATSLVILENGDGEITLCEACMGEMFPDGEEFCNLILV